jgi:hypothetical protein
MSLAAISDNYLDVEFFYQNQIDNYLKAISDDDSDLNKSVYKEALLKLHKLELNYDLLEKDLAVNPTNLRVINAMIQNYQIRINVLQTLYQKLEINETIKKQENEKANNSPSLPGSGILSTYTA